jgi:hypothetical protein
MVQTKIIINSYYKTGITDFLGASMDILWVDDKNVDAEQVGE